MQRIAVIVAMFAATLFAVAIVGSPSHGAKAPAPCAAACNTAEHHMVMAMAPASGAGPASVPDTGSMNESMTGDMAISPHMKMSPSRPARAGDVARANAIVASLRVTLAKYQDYRAAQADGYKQFLANVQQPRYHFTSWTNALAAERGFDARRPTSLIYAKVGDGYKLLGAMYTAPKNASADELDARIPLSIAHWHQHVDICWGPQGTDKSRYFGPAAQFGLLGSIDTQAACAAAGGRFQPVLFNWMVHVYPFESDPAKVWRVDMPGSPND
jgi:hypothetical protein